MAEKTTLQAVMQRHIERSAIDGVYLQMDFSTGEVRKLHPVAAHAMIFQLNDYFVLCGDFMDDDGKQVNVDFYLAKKGRGFTVFQAVVDDRGPLKKLIKAGKAKKVK